ncbi:unnamed protein product, partial [Staurois parvus]
MIPYCWGPHELSVRPWCFHAITRNWSCSLLICFI